MQRLRTGAGVSAMRSLTWLSRSMRTANHARTSVLYARAMLSYHYTLAAIGKHMHNLEDGEQSTNSDLDEAGEMLVAAEDLL